MAKIHEVAINLPHQYYPAIGEFMFRYAQLEYLMHELIWRCIDINNPQGRTLTIGSGMDVLIGTLNTIAYAPRDPWVTSAHVKGEIGNIIKVAKEYKAMRNQLAHGTFQYPENGDKNDIWMHYMKESADQRILPHAKRLTPDVIHQAAGKLKVAMERAKRLTVRIQRERPERGHRPPV